MPAKTWPAFAAGLSRIRNRFLRRPDDEAVLAVLAKLTAIFQSAHPRPARFGRVATNDKVAKLARLVIEAAHEVVVISDSDVRVRPDYLRQVTAPLRDPKVGAVTAFLCSRPN
jgi:ceramide glucosyltransferase